MIILRKKYKFCAAHQYKNTYWSEEKNKEVFGDDYKVHGHNYVVTISLTGPIDKDTGFITDLDQINKRPWLGGTVEKYMLKKSLKIKIIKRVFYV